MSSIKNFIIAIFIFGFISFNKSCPPPKKPETFEFESRFDNGIILKYNKVSGGKIRAQIKTKAFQSGTINFGIVTGTEEEPRPIIAIVVSIINNVPKAFKFPDQDGLEYLSSKKDGGERLVDFNFVVCKSGSKVNFGTDKVFLVSAEAQGETFAPSVKTIEDLAGFIDDATC
jgi:hypothetical protein